MQFSISKLWQNYKHVPRTKERMLFYKRKAESWGTVQSTKYIGRNWESYMSWLLIG